MKILHTSDWHIGRSLYGRKRYDEFTACLDFLAELIETKNVDILLVAGDIFDTGMPSNRAQELYYAFLHRIAGTACRHVVITGGNHDSPSFLNAPRELLKALNVHVIGSATGDPEDEVLLLKNSGGNPEAVICAVPYLRDRDIRTSDAYENLDDKNIKRKNGVLKHYATVCDIALRKQNAVGAVPIICMGHLFAAGGKTIDGDGVRELTIGSLQRIGLDAFPDYLDYVALGHLHLPQKVGGKDHIRYSGSLLPMGFGEAGREKKVVMVELTCNTARIKEITLPCFQALKTITGDVEKILHKIDTLSQNGSRAWLEIEYTGRGMASEIRQQIETAVDSTDMEVLRIKNQQVVERALRRVSKEETLDNLSVDDVFDRLLDAFEVDEEERPGLIRGHRQIISALEEDDKNAE